MAVTTSRPDRIHEAKYIKTVFFCHLSKLQLSEFILPVEQILSSNSFSNINFDLSTFNMYSSLLLALLPAAFAAPLLKSRDATLIAGKYIVKFKGDMHTSAIDEVKASLASAPDFDYAFTGFNGFAGTLSDEELAKLKASDSVCPQHRSIHPC